MASSLYPPPPVITFSSPWVKRPGGRDTSHNWGRHGAQAEAYDIAGKRPAAAAAGGGANAALPGERVKLVVLVVLPYNLLLSHRYCIPGIGHISAGIMLANRFVV